MAVIFPNSERKWTFIFKKPNRPNEDKLKSNKKKQINKSLNQVHRGTL